MFKRQLLMAALRLYVSMRSFAQIRTARFGSPGVRRGFGGSSERSAAGGGAVLPLTERLAGLTDALSPLEPKRAASTRLRPGPLLGFHPERRGEAGKFRIYIPMFDLAYSKP